MCARCAANIDNRPSFAILQSEERSSSSNESEWGGIVHGDNRIPLLIGHFVDNTVPGEACIIYNNVDLSVAKLCCLFDKYIYIVGVHDIPRNTDSSTALEVVDVSGYSSRFGAVDIAYNDLGSFIGKNTCNFGSNALP